MHEKEGEGKPNGVNVDRAAEDANESRSSGMSAAKYYRVPDLLKRARRNNDSRNDEEISRPENDCMNVSSKTTEC